MSDTLIANFAKPLLDSWQRILERYFFAMPKPIGKRQEKRMALLMAIETIGARDGGWSSIRLDDFRPYVQGLKFASSISYALQRLEANGLIEINRDRRAGMERLPNAYKLTQAGQEAIKR